MLYLIGKNLFKIFFKYILKVKVKGTENIPEKGALIICPNHLSYLDPPLVGSMIKRSCYFLAKIELFKNPLFSFILKNVHAYPVRRGTPDRKALKEAFRILKNKKTLVVFPQGTRNIKNKNKVKPGVIYIIYHSRAKVIPVKIENSDKPFKKKISIIYGKEIDFSKFYERNFDKNLIKEMGEHLLNKIFALK